MNDRKLTELFRNLEEGLDLPSPEPAFADALYGRLRTEAAPRRTWRQLVLLVAALLLVAATAGAIAIGSGIIDPAPDQDSLLPVDLLPGHDVDCAPFPGYEVFELPEGVVLEFEFGPFEEGAAYGELHPSHRLTIFEDGLVVVGGHVKVDRGSAPNPVRALPEQTARRLSPTGMALVTRAVADSGLLLRDCGIRLGADLGSRRQVRGLAVRAADGAVAATSWGWDGSPPMTEAEQAAAATLVAKLEDLAVWLPAEAWIEPNPTPFDPDWMVWTERLSPEVAAPIIEPRQLAQAVPAEDVRLPGSGDTVLTFGDGYSEPPTSAEDVERSGRCAVVDLAGAREMYTAFQEANQNANGTFGASGWWFAEGGNWIRVQMRPALIGADSACLPSALGISDPFIPGYVAEAPLGSDIDREFDIDACSLFRSEAVRDAFDLSDWVYLSSAGQDHYGEDPAYRSCYWFSGITGGIGFEGERWDGFVLGAVRTETTTGEYAEQLALEQLSGEPTDAIDGHPVWLRACSSPGSEQGTCVSAVVSAPPFFVIVEVDSGGSPGDPEVIAVRTVIPEILANLAAWQAEHQ